MSKSKSSKIKEGFSTLNGVLVIQLVIMLVLSLFITTTVSNRTKTNSIEHMGAITDERAHIIENYVENAEKVLTSFSRAAQVKNLLENPEDAASVAAAQAYTEKFSADVVDLEGIYISQWNTKVLAHTNPNVVGITTREGEPLAQLQNAMLAEGDGVYDTGIIISPASGKQIVSMYKAIYNDAGEPIGLVGLGIFTDGLINTLDNIPIRGVENSFYSMVNVNDNKYIFNVDKAKVGTEVDNQVVLELCAKYKGETNAATDYFEYKADGASYVSIYSYMPEFGWILMIDDTKSEVFALTTTMRIYLGIFAVIIIGLILVFNSITKKQALINQKLASALAKNNQTRDALNTAMFKDVLTDVNNRVSFTLEIQKTSPSTKKPYYFILFNLCDFSKINAKFGNDAGDHMLVHTVDILKETYPGNDIYRTGSDEFIVVIPAEDNKPDADALMQNTNNALRKLLLPENVDKTNKVYPKYKIAIIKKTKDIDASIVTKLKDMTNNTGEAIQGMLDFKDMSE